MNRLGFGITAEDTAAACPLMEATSGNLRLTPRQRPIAYNTPVRRVMARPGRAFAANDSNGESKEVRTWMKVSYQKDELRSVSWMLAFLKLPHLLSSYAICATLQLWLFRVDWPLLKHSLTVKKIIPRQSSFMTACASGEVERVRELALSGQGMPSCIDETGMPALHVTTRHELMPPDADGV